MKKGTSPFTCTQLISQDMSLSDKNLGQLFKLYKPDFAAPKLSAILDVLEKVLASSMKVLAVFRTKDKCLVGIALVQQTFLPFTEPVWEVVDLRVDEKLFGNASPLEDLMHFVRHFVSKFGHSGEIYLLRRDTNDNQDHVSIIARFPAINFIVLDRQKRTRPIVLGQM
jgi:hypothetical protein